MKDFFAKTRGKLFIFACRLFRRNIHIGPNLRIYKRLIIRGMGRVVIGDNCMICGVQGDRFKYVILETHGPEAEITIGSNAFLFGARFSSKFYLRAGNELFVEDASITDTDFHSIDRVRGEPLSESREKCAVLIGNRVSIGTRSVVVKGVRIGDDAVILPGSVVTKSLPDRCIAMGNPAKPCEMRHGKKIADVNQR